MNGLEYAYLGDAYYELKIRTYLLDLGIRKVDVLHKTAVHYTSNRAQALIIEHLIASNELSEVEIRYFKRGRNNSSRGRKNVDGKTYTTATGFEALIGTLFHKDNMQRCDEIIEKAIRFVEANDEKEE